jgi:RNA polymerase sigma-70 factor (ECF subfamily)
MGLTSPSEWGWVLATVIRLTCNFSLAEEVSQDAFEAATTRWRADGIPEHPRAWLIQTARHTAIDRIRRSKTLAGKLETYAADLQDGRGGDELLARARARRQ